jgi:hypothetical protein
MPTARPRPAPTGPPKTLPTAVGTTIEAPSPIVAPQKIPSPTLLATPAPQDNHLDWALGGFCARGLLGAGPEPGMCRPQGRRYGTCRPFAPLRACPERSEWGRLPRSALPTARRRAWASESGSKQPHKAEGNAEQCKTFCSHCGDYLRPNGKRDAKKRLELCQTMHRSHERSAHH